MKPRAVWQFFEAGSEGEAMHLFTPGEAEPLHTRSGFRGSGWGDRFSVPERLCAAGTEWETGSRRTVRCNGRGEGCAGGRKKAKNEGYYFKSHGMQALAIESAEACAEWLHRRIRRGLGLSRPAGVDHGAAVYFSDYRKRKRYSFGYPACPNLDDQAGTLEAAAARTWKIGIQSLTLEGFMMDPEASVSALVFQHPDCKYFGVGDDAESQ